VRMSVGDFLLKRLAELGSRYLFGVPGDYNLWFLEQVERSNHIEFIGCCNELNAAYAADGSARLVGVSALVTTYGVGELSAIAGVAGAYAERVPIVCIIGAPPLGAIEGRTLLHHTLGDGNFVNMLSSHRDFSVAQTRIEPANARWEIDRVLRSCWLEKRPVYLQLPSDVPALTIEAPEEPLQLAAPTSDPRQLVFAIERISTLIAEADAPAILLDADVARFGLTRPIVGLIQAHSIPFATLPSAKAIIDESHELHLGTYRGAASTPEVRGAIENADCLLCVCVRFTDVATGFFSHRLLSAELINIRAFDVSIGATHVPGLAGTDVLNTLVKVLPVKPRRALPRRPKPPTRIPSQSGQSLTQERFWQRMQDFIQAGDVVLTDIGTCSAGTSGLRMPDGVAVIGQPLWAAVGYGLPALLGTLLAAPHRRQLLFIGDGAFQMTAQELSTILRRGLKPIIFLVNNNGYTIERLILGPGSSYNDINQWRYAEATSFFDARDQAITYTVRTEDELDDALAAAGDRESLVLVELVMSRLDAPGPLVNFAQRCAAFNFPQLATLPESGSRGLVRTSDAGERWPLSDTKRPEHALIAQCAGSQASTSIP
jgi:indolepyruvate decarboxylase